MSNTISNATITQYNCSVIPTRGVIAGNVDLWMTGGNQKGVKFQDILHF